MSQGCWPWQQQGSSSARQPTRSPSDAKRAAAYHDGRSTAREIAELCTIAGQPQLAAEFIATGVSIDEVKRALGSGSPAAGNTLVDGLCAAAKRLDAGAAATMWEQGFTQARARVA